MTNKMTLEEEISKLSSKVDAHKAKIKAKTLELARATKMKDETDITACETYIRNQHSNLNRSQRELDVLIKKSLKSNVVSIKPNVAAAVDKSNDKQAQIFDEVKKLQNLILWMTEQAFISGKQPTQLQLDCLTVLRARQDDTLNKIADEAAKLIPVAVVKK